MEFATGATAADAEGKLLLGELFGDEKSTRAPLTVFATTNAPDPMTELAARLSVVISGETDKNEDEDDAESESGSKSMSFDDAFTESVRDNASARFAHAKSLTGPGAPDSRQMDVILFFARRPGARGGAFVFLLDTRLPRVIERAMAVQLAAETAAQAKSRHIAFVSHEIRNPVNGILASVEAIDELIPVMRAFGSSKVIPNGSGTGDGAASLDEMHDLVRSTPCVHGPASTHGGRYARPEQARGGEDDLTRVAVRRGSDGARGDDADQVGDGEERFASRVGGFAAAPRRPPGGDAPRFNRCWPTFAGTPSSSLRGGA